MSKNRFAGLTAARELQETEQTKKQPPKKVDSAESKTVNAPPTPDATVSAKTTETLPTARRGRPSGKRSDAEYQQVTAYIRRETYRRVTIKLIDQPQKGEFSELVQELLQQWLAE